jgi:hypothetical protein
MGYRVKGLLAVAIAVTLASMFGCFDQRSIDSTAAPGTGGSDGDGDDTRNPEVELPEGQSDFASAGNGGGRGYAGGEEDSGAPADGKNGGSEPRSIEEGDIWKTSGDYLYVLNQYRGLQIIRLSVVDKPKLVASVPILGRPVEMYVRDGNAYVVVSDYFNCWLDGTEGFVREFQGSQLRIVDVRTPETPKVLGGIDIKGFVTDTRIVGEVLYMVSNRYSYYYYDSTDSENLTSVYSITIADPAAVKLVDQIDFVKNEGYENHVNVTENIIFIATPQYGWYDEESGQWRQEMKTTITYIDIHDPDGAIRKGSSFDLPGYVSQRWQMDFYDKVFRVVAPEQAWGNGYPNLFTYQVDDPDHITLLAQMQIKLPREEALTATRFDGNRAYVVTYERKDPLFTIDVSDPAHPVQGGELEMPGWLDYIEPRGDRLVALGHDDATGETVLAVSLFDVGDLMAPKMVQRVTFGEGWGWVPGESDDMQKIFKVLDDMNLILIPFHGWSNKDSRYIGGVQLIDFYLEEVNFAPLLRRGLIEHGGWVERAMPFKERILTVSNEAFQVVDVTDRDKPNVTAALELARNSVDFAVMGGYGIELSGEVSYYWYYDYGPGGRGEPQMQLSTVPLSEPNTANPPAEINIDGSYGRVFTNGSVAYLLGSYYDGTTVRTRVTSYDFSNPLKPEKLDTLDLPRNIDYYYYGWYGYYGENAVQVRPDVLVLYSPNYYYYYDYYWAGSEQENPVYILDLSNPRSLRLASSVTLVTGEYSWISAMKVQDDSVYFSHSVPFETKSGYYYVKYYLDRLDLSDINNPKLLPKVNIPGVFLGLSTDSRYVFTLDTQYIYDPVTGNYNGTYQAVNTLALIDDKAYLRDRYIVQLPYGNNEWWWMGNIWVQGDFAYYTMNHSWYGTVAKTGEADYNDYHSETRLVALDLRIARKIEAASSQEIPVPYAYLRGVSGGRMFVEFYGYASGGMLIYSLADPAQPAFDGFFRTQGYVQKIIEHGGKLYLPSGYYGVQVVDL